MSPESIRSLAVSERRAAEALLLESLVLRMAQGEQAALAELFQRCSARVHAVALSVLQRPEDAEEAVLDTFSQAWERAPAFDPARGEVLTWLLGMAWSRAVDRLRRERRHRRTEPLHPEDGAAAYTAFMDDPVPRLLDALDAESALAGARAQLSAVQQQVLALAFFEDLSHSEIGERTGLPLGTVKSHLRRALAQLSALMGEREPGHG